MKYYMQRIRFSVIYSVVGINIVKGRLQETDCHYIVDTRLF